MDRQSRLAVELKRELQAALLLGVFLAFVVAAGRVRAWLDETPAAVPADAPTAFDVPGIPMLRPAP